MDQNRRWLSAEARVLHSPAATLRGLANYQRGGWWVLMRRLPLLAFVFGCTVSLLASGRLTLRLIADGAVSFYFPFEAITRWQVGG
jgi:hypothetical protein